MEVFSRVASLVILASLTAFANFRIPRNSTPVVITLAAARIRPFRTQNASGNVVSVYVLCQWQPGVVVVPLHDTFLIIMHR